MAAVSAALAPAATRRRPDRWRAAAAGRCRSLALKTGPPSATQLPTSNAAREDAEDDRPRRSARAGTHPSSSSPPASEVRSPNRARLAALRRAQRRIAADPAVQAVIGPGQIERRVAPLQEGGNDLLAGEGEASPGKLAQLGAQPRPRGAGRRPACAVGSPRPPRAPGCSRTARAGPARVRRRSPPGSQRAASGCESRGRCARPARRGLREAGRRPAQRGPRCALAARRTHAGCCR